MFLFLFFYIYFLHLLQFRNNSKIAGIWIEGKSHNRNGKRCLQKQPLLEWLDCTTPINNVSHQITIIFFELFKHKRVLQLQPSHLHSPENSHQQESAMRLLPTEADCGHFSPPEWYLATIWPSECGGRVAAAAECLDQGITIWGHCEW